MFCMLVVHMRGVCILHGTHDGGLSRLRTYIQLTELELRLAYSVHSEGWNPTTHVTCLNCEGTRTPLAYLTHLGLCWRAHLLWHVRMVVGCVTRVHVPTTRERSRARAQRACEVSARPLWRACAWSFTDTCAVRKGARQIKRTQSERS